MSLVSLSFKHGKTLEEARAHLESSVQQIGGQFAALIQRIEWSEDRNSVQLAGTGFEIRMRVDAEEVHVTGDIPILARLLASPLVSGVKNALERNFQKRLT